MTSQFSEDTHIAAIFEEIGEGTKVLCDIGARLQGSNSAALIEKGFTGVLVDANPDACKELTAKFPQMKVLNRCVRPEDINEICPPDAWFISIDIDSWDWWVWANLQYRPALVVIESNPLECLFVAKRECAAVDRQGYGASVEGLKWLGDLKRYDYLGRTQVNCFFVRRDLNCQYRLPDPPPPHLGTPSRTANNVFSQT